MPGNISNPALNPAVVMGARGIGPAAPTPIAGDTLAAAFTFIVLLNGGATRAEPVIVDAFSRINPCRASRRELFLSCASAAISSETAAGSGEVEESPSGFPPELRRILRLPAHIRRCFVLRMLGGLSREDCAQLDIYNVDEGAVAAARELARMGD
jgi:hypothetical protein